MQGNGCWRGRHVDTGTAVEIEIREGLITRIVNIADRPELPWISPGWIDLQVNGCGGFDLNAPAISIADVQGVTRYLWSKGVTRYLPTVITSSYERMEAAFATIAAACSHDPLLAASIGGIHMEGPYFAREDGPRGAHSLQYVRSPDSDEFVSLQEASGNRICLVTLAPETDPNMRFIRYLREHGVIASIGHTGASPEQIRLAADAGASMSTHLGNGSHLLLPRHPNYIWEQLSEDRLYAGLIADGHHLPLAVLKVMLRAKGDKAFIVSDCVSLAGKPPGEYAAAIGGEVILMPNGKLCTMNNHNILAGSAATLDMQLCTLLSGLSLSMQEACLLAAKRPAEAMGWSHYGQIAAGFAGDLTLFHYNDAAAELAIAETVVAGVSVYSG